MSQDFEVVSGKRSPLAELKDASIHIPQNKNRIGDLVADHFDQILDLAANIVEIEKMRMQSQAVLKQMEESRKTLLAEAEAYAIKKNADTNDVVQKIQVVREMMCDFYQHNHRANLSGEEFSRIISSVVNEIGKA
jgi:hypothetical protein